MTFAVPSFIESFQVRRFIRRQQRYIAIAVAIYAGLWAADRPAEIGATLVYTLPLCNFIALIQDHANFLYRRKRPLVSWAIYIGLMVLISVAGVAVVNILR